MDCPRRLQSQEQEAGTAFFGQVFVEEQRESWQESHHHNLSKQKTEISFRKLKKPKQIYLEFGKLTSVNHLRRQ